jgi:hypothetical protein
MDREDLVALRNAIDSVLAWPDSVRAEVARWLASGSGKPNGQDHAAASAATLPAAKRRLPAPASSPRQVKRRAKRSGARATEAKLLAAVRDNPGASERILAAAVKVHRSTVGERLRALAHDGRIEKDEAGHWRMKGETPATEPPAEIIPAVAAPVVAESQPAKWIKPISDYDRRVTSEVHGSRFG